MQALVLGTAQWGNAYGITNAQGRLCDEEIADIAGIAAHRGIGFVDTASGYGDAENRLAPWAQTFEVITKVKFAGPMSIRDQFDASCRNIEMPRLHGCLIHDWSVLSEIEAVAALKELQKLKVDGRVESIGVSAYDPQDLVKLMQLGLPIDYAQIPVSVLDRRFELSGYPQELRDLGCRIQARSIFLQGLLLASPENLGITGHADLVAFHSRCSEVDTSPLLIALKYVQRLEWVDQVVIGATTVHELTQICDAWDSEVSLDFAGFARSNDANLIDPRKWSTK